MPIISVVVPVYKAEPYLRRCADSILGQSFPDFELILVDDGSPDNCGAICDEYARTDPRVHVIHQPNGGLSAARNAGIDWAFAHSDSQWLTFIDSDDWIHPEYLERLLRAADSSGVGVSVCGYCTPTEFGMPEIPEDQFSVLLTTPEELWCERNVNATIACAKLYRRFLFERVRYPAGKLHEDEYTTYKVLFATPQVAFIAAPLYCYFQNEGGITRSEWSPRRLDALDALDEQAAFFSEKGYPNALVKSLRAFTYNTDQTWTVLKGRPGSLSLRLWLRRRERKHVWRFWKELKRIEDRDTILRAFPILGHLELAAGKLLRKLKLR